MPYDNCLFHFPSIQLQEQEIIDVLTHCRHCSFATCKNNIPYVVTMAYTFQYNNGQFTFYLVCNECSKKVENILANKNVSLTMYTNHLDQSNCSNTGLYDTVYVQGRVSSMEPMKTNNKLLKDLFKYNLRYYLTDFTCCDTNAIIITIEQCEVTGKLIDV